MLGCGVSRTRGVEVAVRGTRALSCCGYAIMYIHENVITQAASLGFGRVGLCASNVLNTPSPSPTVQLSMPGCTPYGVKSAYLIRAKQFLEYKGR